MKVIFRDYEHNRDHKQCEALVNEAWDFDKNFSPPRLANLAKRLYTNGSVLGSNYRQVIEIDGNIAGFIFSFNEFVVKPKRNFLFKLNILWEFFWIKSNKASDKNKLLNAINTHEMNRSKVVNRGKSEIVLFVVGRNFRGMGYGKRLLSDFLSHCKDSNVKSIIVETNKLGASSFYEQQGFKHIGDFDSPLHEYATKGGQACMYEYNCK